jgi:dihydrodipicolinate synthase/N-acetylneuraminate lyase
MNNHLRGLIPALATPLNEDFTVDRGAMRALVHYVMEGGAMGIFVLSSTGEGPMLPDEQREVAVTTAAEAAGGRVPVLMHVPETSTERVLRWVRHAPELGAAYIVSTLPFYFRHAGQQTLDFYHAVADASSLPVFLYNVPFCTGVHITHTEIAQLAAHPNIVGIKDSTQDWRHFQKVIRIKDQRPDFLVFNGDEEALASSVLMGGDGGVLGLGNVCPALCTEVFEAADAGDVVQARRLQAELTDLQQIWFCFSCPSGALKLALSLLGLAKPFVTPPLTPAPPELEPFMRDLLQRHGLI